MSFVGRAGPVETRKDRLQQRFRGRVAKLDLDFAKPILDAEPLDDGNIVVHDFGQDGALAAQELQLATQGREGDHRLAGSLETTVGEIPTGNVTSGR